MADKRFFPDGNIAGWFAPLNYATNPAQPTIAEATAATVIPLTRATSFTDTDFGADASNTNTDQSWADASAVTERGAAQFGGTWSFYYPEHYWEKSSEYAAVFDALGEARTEGYIITRVDGTFNGNAANTPLAAGQAVNIYKVMTTAYSPQITGETSFRQNITFSARGRRGFRSVPAPSVPGFPASCPVCDSLPPRTASHHRPGVITPGRCFNALQGHTTLFWEA